MPRADKVGGGPVGKGTVFCAAVKSLGRAAEMRIELTGYDGPGRLACRTATELADIGGALTFAPVPGGHEAVPGKPGNPCHDGGRLTAAES